MIASRRSSFPATRMQFRRSSLHRVSSHGARETDRVTQSRNISKRPCAHRTGSPSTTTVKKMSLLRSTLQVRRARLTTPSSKLAPRWIGGAGHAPRRFLTARSGSSTGGSSASACGQEATFQSSRTLWIGATATVIGSMALMAALEDGGILNRGVYADAADRTASDRLRGKDIIIGKDGTEEPHIDPSTKTKLPRRLASPVSLQSAGDGEDAKPFVIVASGVRTVSFLRIQVYVASLYLDEAEWQRFTSSRPASASSSQTLEELLRSALEAGVPAVLKITPVRNTDFAHLRDGFARAIQSRLKYARKGPSPPSSEQEEALAISTQHLKECFPKTSLKKGENLDIVFSASKSAAPSSVTAAAARAVGGVDVSLEHGGKVLGTVRYDSNCGDLDVGKLLLQAYAAEKEAVSDEFKRALEQKLIQ